MFWIIIRSSAKHALVVLETPRHRYPCLNGFLVHEHLFGSIMFTDINNDSVQQYIKNDMEQISQLRLIMPGRWYLTIVQ